ncbi:helix-turn-helix domain-containing protein [Affinibrenneria salicis]|uniref:Helix-turn-helix domain-containing protein n=2 Tax=Affinibrenneria salicis TaxID=2590031 RepID=A0A5J5FYB5_9GAMM|nr:helix-turn-helix domain-containing protein [Affinibrenneria salicis]
MKELDIAEVARISGVAPSALRFYEKKGLISSVGRHGLRRQYREDVLQRLALIALGRTAGFSLEQIATVFAADGNIAIDRQMLIKRASEVDDAILQLTRVRDGLRHVANCSAPDHMACPEFNRILASAQLPRRTQKKELGAKNAKRAAQAQAQNGK